MTVRPTSGPPAVRAVRVLRPRQGASKLTDADVTGLPPMSAGEPIVVELGYRSYDFAAARTLAYYAACGHPIDIRGQRHESRLRDDIELVLKPLWRDQLAFMAEYDTRRTTSLFG